MGVLWDSNTSRVLNPRFTPTAAYASQSLTFVQFPTTNTTNPLQLFRNKNEPLVAPFMYLKTAAFTKVFPKNSIFSLPQTFEVAWALVRFPSADPRASSVSPVAGQMEASN